LSLENVKLIILSLSESATRNI